MPRHLFFRVRGLVSLLLVTLLCGCVAYRPRLISYDGVPELPAGQVPSVTVTGDGVRVQAKAGDEWNTVKTGDLLSPGSLLMTDGKSQAVVELPGGQGQISVGEGSVIEFARFDAQQGALVVISSGQVSGNVTGVPIEIVSSCGGALALTPNEGATVPFTFRHGRDAQYLAVMKSLGLQADWAIFNPSRAAREALWGDLVHHSSIPANTTVVPEPKTWSLAIAGSVLLGVFCQRRR